MSSIFENIEKYLLKNEYESAFVMFLLYAGNMSSLDRDELIRYFTEFVRKKHGVTVH